MIFSKDDKKILRAAARVIETRGHTKHKLNSGDPMKGKVCLMGAVLAGAQNGYADWGNRDSDAARIVTAIGQHLLKGDGADEAIGWNNRSRRKPSEVIALLRKAANTRR